MPSDSPRRRGFSFIQPDLISKQTHGWRVQLARNLIDVLNHNEQPLVERGKTIYVLVSSSGSSR